MSYDRPLPSMTARRREILSCLSPLGVLRTRPEIVSALGGCCGEAVAVELRALVSAGLLSTRRPPEGMLQYTLTDLGAKEVGRG